MRVQNNPEKMLDDASHHEDVPQGTTTDVHRQKTTLYMLVFSFWVGTFGWLANFDAAFGGIVLIMDSYKRAFGTCVGDVCSLTPLQQSLVQLTILFVSGGGALSAIVGDRFGRRGTLQVACLIIAVSAGGMMGTAGSFTNYMVCKCIGGLGIGMIYSAAPTWGSESVNPGKRGFLMSFYNVGLALGNVVAGAVCLGSSSFSTDWAWRTPIFCQIPAAIILGLLTLCFHESPRWLLTKGKTDAARRSFAKFNKKELESPVITALIEEVNRHIELERALRQSSTWTGIFRGNDGKRTHIAVLALLGNAITGVQFVIPYTALFLAQIGLTQPFALNVAISASVLIGTVPGPFLCEWVGRRRSLLAGYSAMGASMLIFAATATGLGQSSHTAQSVLVAFLCFWAFVFGATSGPIAWVASAEMHSLRMRTFGQSYAVSVYGLFSFGAAFWTPYMLNAEYGNMGTNVGYFYFAITVVVIILTFLIIPETGRLSLEQIDEHFESGRPAWKTSLMLNKRIASGKN
ncbi:hypothetical protein JX265_007267 [Neoarthrinium moseri]|uniref:Major facilitator superfamily (MFS) profile domain-containing protein n=1 Tax=Neoarthrinium moseri TaxID=1658444 RepID=A0A9P9WJZ7_9PEZI|nr:uncharacterized protein JN550_012102 [Neoarthrinium moseri]KAI1850942.1 hypothetical protein JX266_003607 [Neoarthrinium moseri]KAI1859293.1 hypothetical protein JN550_012102 [Neoarthrinium moseri]KAI1867465.1 hypothetical protein JX265_007267 [Neoarthrinium moseri]